VSLASGTPEDESPRETALYRVSTSGARRGQVARTPLPENLNLCLDCGPTFRVGADGEVWMYQLEEEEYRVLRLPGRTAE
jgi:hypothetical protein